MASATTPAAGTAVTSLRWLIAFAGSPVRTSTVSSARGTVEIGFMAARNRSIPPVLMPPSIPPARLVRRRTPSCDPSISSWACEPRRQSVTDHLNHAPECVPVLAGGVDLRLHRGARTGVQASHRVKVHPFGIGWQRDNPLRRAYRANRHHVTQNLHAKRLAGITPGHLPKCHPGGCLPGARPLKHWTGI